VVDDFSPAWEARPPHDPLIDLPPPGFHATPNRGPFTGRNGPMYHSRMEGGARHGFRVRPFHCNSMGIVHGGMMAAFMDGVFGHLSAQTTGQMSVTVRLTLDYLGSARIGDWVIGEGVVSGQQGDLLFVDGRACVGDASILKAHAVFKLTRAHAQKQHHTQGMP
jgi:uncharacterized protein (TIGR00369 family)